MAPYRQSQPSSRRARRPTIEPGSGARRPLIVTQDEALLDDLLRLCAAAGVEPDVAIDVSALRTPWVAAPIVFVGEDVTAAVECARLPHREDVVVVGRDLDDATIWRRAFAIGAAHVVVLPDGDAWVADALAAARDHRPGGLVVAVIGGRGGVGATCLAVALSQAVLRGGRRALLVDADPLGGGIDLALGAEQVAGLRWSGLADAQGVLAAQTLEDVLPRLGDLSVLAWDRALGGAASTGWPNSSGGGPWSAWTPAVDAAVPTGGDLSAEAMLAVLDAGARGNDLVVVDLPRRLDTAAVAALQQVSVTLLAVPGDLRGVAASAQVAAAVRPHCPDLRAVVRKQASSGLSLADISSSLELPLAGELAAEHGLGAALERGDPPGSRAHGPLARFANRFVTELLACSEGAVA